MLGLIIMTSRTRPTPNARLPNPTMISLQKPKAVLFDWDGTLMDSVESIYTCFNHVQKHFGRPPLTLEQFQENMKIGTAKEIFKKVFQDTPDLIQEAYDVFYANIPDIRAQYATFMPGAREFLEDLHARDIPMGIVSNMNHTFLVKEMAHLGVDTYFEAIVGAGEAPRGKPSPDHVYVALDRMGIDRSEAKDIWFIGDMEPDERAARAAGCPFIYYVGQHDPNALKAQYVFSDYDQFKVDMDTLF